MVLEGNSWASFMSTETKQFWPELGPIYYCPGFPTGLHMTAGPPSSRVKTVSPAGNQEPMGTFLIQTSTDRQIDEKEADKL